MISLKGLGITTAGAPQHRAALQITGDSIPGGVSYYGASDAIVTGSVAAIEAVAGRAAKLMRMATVEGRLAQSVLTPPVLSDIARRLVTLGESLHWMDVRRGMPRAYPAQWDWSVLGPVDDRQWVIEATVPGGQTVEEHRAIRGHWLYVLNEPDPDYPYRGVPAAYRAGLTHAILVSAEEALQAETKQPVKTIVAFPDGVGDETVKDIRARILNRTIPVILPPTTSRGFGAGATNAPQSDWVPRRMQPAPEQWLVELADRTSARIVAALGAHPEIIGAGSGTGTLGRESRRQFSEVVRDPLAKLIEYETSLVLGEKVRLHFPPNPDTSMAVAKTALVEMQTEKLRREMAAAVPSDAD